MILVHSSKFLLIDNRLIHKQLAAKLLLRLTIIRQSNMSVNSINVISEKMQ